MKDKWEDGYTIAVCMKQMTSKEATQTAVKELIEFHVKVALENTKSQLEYEAYALYDSYSS